MLKNQSENLEQRKDYNLSDYVMNNVDFKPIKTNDYELLLGYDKNNEPIKIDVNRNPHLVIAGDTRSGKSAMLQQIATNLIINDSNIQIYISQIWKSDLIMFKKYKNVKQYSDNLISLNSMLNNISTEMKIRREKINDMIINFQGDSIRDYNKLNENKMDYMYIIIDGYENLIEDYYDTREEKELKKGVINQIKSILLYGMQCGVQLILSAIPHGDFFSANSFILANISNKLSFRISNQVMSRRLNGNADTSRLSPRCFILHNSSESINGRSYALNIKDIAKVLNKE